MGDRTERRGGVEVSLHFEVQGVWVFWDNSAMWDDRGFSGG